MQIVEDLKEKKGLPYATRRRYTHLLSTLSVLFNTSIQTINISRVLTYIIPDFGVNR